MDNSKNVLTLIGIGIGIGVVITAIVIVIFGAKPSGLKLGPVEFDVSTPTTSSQLPNVTRQPNATAPQPTAIVNPSSSTTTSATKLIPSATLTQTLTQFTRTSSSTATLTLQPTQAFTTTPGTRLSPHYWREWAITPELSGTAQKIIYNIVNNPNLDLHTFSKVGDCQMTSGTFLGGFANGKYKIPDEYTETVIWFSDSMLEESVTAANGLGINSVLNPMFGLAAGYKQCNRNETPLDCELRTRRPAFVLIAMGTNWKPNGEVSFEKYLRIVVDRILETGALPILSTKADNIEGDWKLNRAIAQVAYDYDLPLVNVWRSVQDLPNHGLEAPKNIYLTGDGWMRRNYAWLEMLDKIRIALQERQ